MRGGVAPRDQLLLEFDIRLCPEIRPKIQRKIRTKISEIRLENLEILCKITEILAIRREIPIMWPEIHSTRLWR